MSDRTATSIVRDAQEFIDEEGGIGMFIVNVGFGGIIMSMIYGGIDTIEAFWMLVWSPVREFAVSLTAVVNAAIGGQADIVWSSIETAIISFETGAASYLGPFAPLLGIIVIGAMTWLIVRIWQEIPISPLTFLRGRLGR